MSLFPAMWVQSTPEYVRVTVSFNTLHSLVQHPALWIARPAEAVRVVRASGLPNHTDAMFTTIEGDWDACLEVVRRAVEVWQAPSRPGTE